MTHTAHRHIARQTLLVAAFYGTAMLSLRLPILPATAAMSCLATGVAVAALTLGGLRYWPAVAVGTLLVSWRLGSPMQAVALLTLGNTAQAVLSAWVLRRFKLDPALPRVRDVLLLTTVGVVLTPFIGAVAGGISQHWIEADISWTLWELMALRAMGDTTAMLIVAPLLLVLGSVHPARQPNRHIIEAAAILGLLVIIGHITFSSHHFDSGLSRAAASLAMALLVWAAYRFEQPGAVVSLAVMALMAVLGAAEGGGPFARIEAIETLAGLCAYLAIVSFIALMLAAAVTERAATRRALTDSEERYRALVDNSPDAILVHQDMRVVYLNHQALKLFGATQRAQLMGHHVMELVHPDFREMIQARITHARANNVSNPLHKQTLLRLDGSPVVAEAVATACVFRGSPGIQVVIRDITERHEAREALRLSNERYRSLFKHMPEATLVYDRATLQILAVNEAAQRQYGYSLEEFLAMRITGLRPAQDVPSLIEQLDKDRQGYTNRGVWRHLTKDGHELRVEIIADEIEFDGKPARIVMMRNVTVQHEAQEALRRSEEHYRRAAESNRRLLSEVNHRVRNNLASLLGLIELSQGGADDVTNFAASLRRRIQAMTQVHNLLVDASWQDLSLDSLLNDLLRWMPSPAGQPRVDMQGPETPISPRQALPLAMTLQELLANSIKHGAHGSVEGRIDIAWEVIDDDAPEGRRVRLTWRERGGPTIDNPIKPSLGTQLIEGFIRFELGGQCRLSYPRDGVDHMLEFALEPATAPQSREA